MREPIELPDLTGVDPSYRDSFDSISRITTERFADILRNLHRSGYDAVLPTDVRYLYEFIGGHIFGAKNIRCKKDLHRLFDGLKKGIRLCIVFHCEYSTVRGNHVCKKFKSEICPNYEGRFEKIDVFLLTGGYKDFYKKYPELCDGGYIAMRDERYKANGSLQSCSRLFNEEFEYEMTYNCRDIKLAEITPPSYLMNEEEGTQPEFFDETRDTDQKKDKDPHLFDKRV